MIVYKNYLKIAKTYWKTILIYTVVFVSLAYAMTAMSNTSTDYQTTEIKAAIVNRDKDNELIKGLENYVDERGEIVEIEDNDEALKDALFYRTVDFIMIIPENYYQDFIDGKDVTIETMEVPNSYAATYSQSIMNKYLNTARTYLKAGVEESEAIKLVNQDLNKTTEVTIYGENGGTDYSAPAIYYNFSNYMLVVMIMVICTSSMIVFNKKTIKNRNLVSPVTFQSTNRQLLLGSVTVGLCIWIIYVVLSLILYPSVMFSINGLLYVVNSLLLCIMIISLGFLICKFTDQQEIVNGFGNVIGLGSSFLCGAFVPQSMLSPFVLTIAKVLPSYWYIKANDTIGTITDYSFKTLQPVFMDMAILFGFIVLIYIVIQVVSRLNIRR